MDKLKFDLNQTLREHNLENYKTDQIVKVKGVVIDFCKGKLADLNKVRVIFKLMIFRICPSTILSSRTTMRASACSQRPS